MGFVDLGAIEVAKTLTLGKQKSKASVDSEKIVRALSILLHDLLKKRELLPTQRSALQVIGFLCCGWSCTVIRMWFDIKSDKYVMRERHFTVPLGKDLTSLKEFLCTLVRYRELARSTGDIVSYHHESDPE